jgi:triosephosphate isomerase (TIM)
VIRTPVLAANWKMHHGPEAARAFVRDFTAAYAPRTDRTVILCPPALSMTAVVDALAGRDDIAVGAQNIWTEDKGAFTGETSAPMVREAGARYVLVGHSERRHVFGETNAQTAAKCAAAARHGLVPILCVGEKLEQREEGRTEAVVLEQLREGLAGQSLDAMLIAYEPVWAIGTGRTATPEDAAAVHKAIRAHLAGLSAAGKDIPILYGGSVNPGNAAALLAAPEVGGLLVGGASLDATGWKAICET